MCVIETIELSELREYLRRRVAERKRSAAADRTEPAAEPGPPPSNGSRIDELIAEGKVRPPKRRGPLPLPLRPMGKVDESEAASRALDYVRGDR